MHEQVVRLALRGELLQARSMVPAYNGAAVHSAAHVIKIVFISASFARFPVVACFCHERPPSGKGAVLDRAVFQPVPVIRAQ